MTAFGINAFTAANAGDEVVEKHTEETLGHEEIYAVISGHATFTVDGEEVDAPAGTLVYLDDVTQLRHAIAKEPGTTVLAIGGVPGRHEISAWEYFFPALEPMRNGDHDTARRIIEVGLAERDLPVLHYQLACIEAVAGNKERALDELRARSGRRGATAGRPRRPTRTSRRSATTRASRGNVARMSVPPPAKAPPPPKAEAPKPPRFRVAWWVTTSIIGLLLLNYWAASMATQQAARVRIPYSPVFLQNVQAGKVKEIVSKGTAIQGTFKAPERYLKSKPTTRFSTEVPAFANTDELSRLLQSKAVVINAQPLQTGAPWWESLLIGFGPTILLVGLLVWISRRAGQRAGRARGVRALEGAAISADRRQGHLQGRGGHRRGEGGADGDRRLPAQPRQVPPPRRPDSARRPTERPARNG